jgi:hypothetical protein
VLGHYVRETKALTLEDAVRKMTGLPASIIGLVDRGFLAVGMAADITVFDPATIIDHATYEQPTLRSDGIRDVLVNGRIALRDGQATGEQSGRVLSRSENMPSRAMRTLQARSVSVKSKDFRLDVTQVAGDRARGRFRFRDPKTGIAVTIEEFGVLQADASGKWASFTGRERPDRAILVIVDGGNPLNPTPVIRTEVEGGPKFEGTLDAHEYSITAK